jgi:UDP-2-acetamido-3-amino-2,3-dideoxy-glucuronate N-acetyltransferase
VRESGVRVADANGPLGVVRNDRRIDESAFVHRHACVDQTVAIGARSRVWQFASVVRGAAIGEDCSIASCAIVDGAELGDRVIVSHGAFIDPGIRIGNDVFIGPHVSLCNDAWPRVDKTGFDMDALISGEFVTMEISSGASLGAGVVVLPGIQIGEGAMIAAGSVVTRGVPRNHLYKRDGTVVKIDPSRMIARMRHVEQK